MKYFNKKLISGLVSILLSLNAFGQTVDNGDVFPGSWLGTYKGQMLVKALLILFLLNWNYCLLIYLTNGFTE